MERKKILIVGPSPTKSKGGMATVISEIMEDDYLKSSVDIDIFESYVDGNKTKRLLYSIFAFIKFCATKNKYDIYHIHAASRGSTFRKGYYVKMVKKWNKKVIFHIHGAQYIEFYNEISDKKKRRVKEILHEADRVVALSQDWKEKFDNIFKLDNCIVLKNGINMQKLQPSINNPADFQKSFLVLGRIGKRKGTYDLIEAFKLVKFNQPNVICYVAGDGEIDKATEIIKKNNLQDNVIVVGWADYDKKIELLSKVSTVILPSYNEGLPMAILEGMASGKAIISTTVGAIPEVVSKDNGILIEPGDVKALAKSIDVICNDLDLLNHFKTYNIKKITENYSMETMHIQLLEYYKSV